MGLAFLCGQTTNSYTTDEKTKLAGIETGANKTVVDNSLSASSTNPVQNNVVKAALDNKLNTTGGTISGRLDLDGKIVLSTTSYGSSLPSSGVAGQVFFLRV
jgi:hypothetical protein